MVIDGENVSKELVTQKAPDTVFVCNFHRLLSVVLVRVVRGKKTSFPPLCSLCEFLGIVVRYLSSGQKDELADKNPSSLFV